MKVALVYPVRIAGGHRFGWRWRSETDAEESAHTFAYFFQCVDAAKKAGYECKFDRVGDSAPPPGEWMRLYRVGTIDHD